MRARGVGAVYAGSGEVLARSTGLRRDVGEERRGEGRGGCRRGAGLLLFRLCFLLANSTIPYGIFKKNNEGTYAPAGCSRSLGCACKRSIEKTLRASVKNLGRRPGAGLPVPACARLGLRARALGMEFAAPGYVRGLGRVHKPHFRVTAPISLPWRLHSALASAP